MLKQKVDFTKVTNTSPKKKQHSSDVHSISHDMSCLLTLDSSRMFSQRQVADSTNGFLLAHNGLTSPDEAKLEDSGFELLKKSMVIVMVWGYITLHITFSNPLTNEGPTGVLDLQTYLEPVSLQLNTA